MNQIIHITKKIAETAFLKGIHHVVLSPGSRSAPLTIAFARHPGIITYVIPDERSAGYIALGMSLILQQPIGLICTSGTAAINLFSAVAEAFYQHVPLIIFTADRPPEWIDQADGQTIRQVNLYGDHVKKYYNFPSDQDFNSLDWYVERIINDAVNYACEFIPGPVHINVPTREPFYPDPEEKYIFNEGGKIIETHSSMTSIDHQIWTDLGNTWEGAARILIVGGQGRYDENFIKALSQFSEYFSLPLIGDSIANIHKVNSNLVTHHDLILSGNDMNKETLMPDLLITFGQAVVSKNLKLFLRRHSPTQHWHIQKAGIVPDTFQSLTTTIYMYPEEFFREACSKLKGENKSLTYLTSWKILEDKASSIINNFFPQSSFSELEAVYKIIQYLPNNINLHLANSMPVRLVNLIGMLKPGIEIFSNRGVCGIDGCTSTALGIAIHSEKLNVLITGDMAFFYDRNGLWHNHIPSNFRIIILNNHGGGIFRLIDGPSDLPELEEYFVTDQKLTARNSGSDFNLDYILCKDANSLGNSMPTFLRKSKKAKILEIETDSQINKIIFDSYISQFK